MAFTTLIDTGALAGHLSDPAWVVVDCRFALDDEAWGAREYAARHIPGAVYADLAHDLSGELSGRNGRHPLPKPEVLTRTLGRFGITTGVQVIAYDQDTGMYASRLWWLLRWMGHDRVAVLDGGFAKWMAEQRPTSTSTSTSSSSREDTRAPRLFSGSPRWRMVVGVDEVARLVANQSARLVDARAPERYRGDVEPIDKAAGHIPGAVNHFFKQNLDELGTFLSAEELRERFVATVGGATPEQVVCYCGSGVTACHNLLALEHAGLHGARLYAGSWSEWSGEPSRPVETSSRPA
jgi:thiosulfate/3-mercaptopyruvate sulfurtransferase